MARPRESDREAVREKVVHVRITKGQLLRWEAKAKQFGLTVGQWLRSVADRDARM